MDEDFDDYDDVIVGEDGWTDYERASNNWWLKNINFDKVINTLKESSALVEKQEILKNATKTIIVNEKRRM